MITSFVASSQAFFKRGLPSALLLALIGLICLPFSMRSAEADKAKSTKSSESETSIPKSRPPGATRTLRVFLPLTAQILEKKAFMRNSPWPNNCDLSSSHYMECPINHGECPINWSHVRNMRVTTTPRNKVVSAEFTSWSHCNLRWAKLYVKWKK